MRPAQQDYAVPPPGRNPVMGLGHSMSASRLGTAKVSRSRARGGQNWATPRAPAKAAFAGTAGLKERPGPLTPVPQEGGMLRGHDGRLYAPGAQAEFGR
jgi:hypothetical protein